LGIGEGLGPAAEGLVGRDGHGGLLLEVGEDLEEKICAAPVELHVAELAGDGLRECLLISALCLTNMIDAPMVEQSELLAHLGSALTNRPTERLRRFAFIPQPLLEGLAGEALNETWGRDTYVLMKYLAITLGWSIEQGRYTIGDEQFYLTAGTLQTRYGTPLYLVFEKNHLQGRQPWILVHVGSQVAAPQLPSPPDIPTGAPIPPGAEIVMIHDHILGNNADRVAFLRDTPRVAQMCAVAGAIQWSLFRGLQLNYWYFGRMNYVVPLYLQSRENITLAPDLVAPIEVSENSLLVRTVLLPHMPYANARASVRRHDQLPAWMLDCWNSEAERMQETDIENPEPQIAADQIADGGLR